jgi:hypothetical protein
MVDEEAHSDDARPLGNDQHVEGNGKAGNVARDGRRMGGAEIREQPNGFAVLLAPPA